MRRFLLFVGFAALLAGLGAGGWLAWPILFPGLPSGWMSTLARVDAALVQKRPDLARALLDKTPATLSVGAWLQWEKRVDAVARAMGAWSWAADLAAQARRATPGNPDLSAFEVWALLQAGKAGPAAALAEQNLKGGPWDSLRLQAVVESQKLASGDWSALRAALRDPGPESASLFNRLSQIDPDPGLRKNALLAALLAGDLDGARTHLGVLTPAQRDAPPFDRLQGLLAYDQGDWNRAAALLKSLAQRQPDSLLVLADVYLHLGDGEQARLIYDQMLADQPDAAPLALLVNRATLALDADDAAKALFLLTRALARPEGNLDKVRLLLLEARFRLGENEPVKRELDRLTKSAEETALTVDAELLKGRLYPAYSSVPRLWSLLHRHPDDAALAERLAWLNLSLQDNAAAYRALDLHRAALAKASEPEPWWSWRLRALALGVENRLDEAAQALAQVPVSWRDPTFYANLAQVNALLAQQADAARRQPFLETALDNLTRGLELLPPSQKPAELRRRSAWLARRGEVQVALLPLRPGAERPALQDAAAKDFRQAVDLDPENLRASFLLRQTQAAPQEKP